MLGSGAQGVWLPTLVSSWGFPLWQSPLHRRQAHPVVAHLVANFRHHFGRSRDRVFLGLDLDQKYRLAFVGFGFQVEGRIQGALWLWLEDAKSRNRGVIRNAYCGRDRPAGGRRE